MGGIRGFFVVIVSVLLLLSIFSSVLLSILTSSLNYNTLQQESKESIKGILEEQMEINSVVDTAYPFMQIYCKTNPEYTFYAQGFAFTFPCNITSEGKEIMFDKGIDYLIKGAYYKQYDCEFMDCFKKTEVPTFLFSLKTYLFIRNIFYISLAVFFLLFILLFFLIEKKTNLPILAGSLLIISSLPFFRVANLINLIPNKLAVKVAGLFFSTAPSVSIRVLIAGIILLTAGILLKIFKVGFFISKNISKFKKPQSKEVKKPAIKEIKKISKIKYK
jgi:hypothetical protein